MLRKLNSYQPGRSVREVIQAVTEGLNHIYSDTVERMDPLIRMQMIQALYFVMNAKKPLKLSALMALSQSQRTFSSWADTSRQRVGGLDIQVPRMNDIEGNAPARLERDIQEYCSTFTTNGTEMKLLHSSAYDFLEQKEQLAVFCDTFADGPGSQHSLPFHIGQGSLYGAHGVMAVLCLQYIFAAFHEEEAKEDAFGFIDYACSFWTDHIREAGKAIPYHIYYLVKKLLYSEHHYFFF